MAGEYGGDVSPDEAMALLQSDKDAVLVDVRTTPEWSFVGVPDLSAMGREPVFLEWQSYPTMALNADFVSDSEAANSPCAGRRRMRRSCSCAGPAPEAEARHRP